MKAKRALLAILFVIMFVAPGCGPSQQESVADNDVVNGQRVGDGSEEANTEIEGQLTLSVDGDTLTAVLNSNVPDGGIFEILVMTKTDTLIASVPIKGGTLNQQFQVPESWGPCYISGTAMFSFNGAEPQPQAIRGMYGEKGENITGDLASPDGKGKLVRIKANDIAYPSKDVVNAERDKALNQALKDYIAVGDGFILSIDPHGDDAWDVVYVTVNDDWYLLADYEKERLAEAIGDYVSDLVITSGKHSYTGVYLVDSYGKEVATPGMFGGYKIK